VWYYKVACLTATKVMEIFFQPSASKLYGSRLAA
jgi:hypothetical protein